MIRILTAAAAALLLAAPASAFDNSTCKSFLVGSWTMTTDKDAGGKKAHYEGHSVYGADGTFTRKMIVTVEGAPEPKTIEQAGTWDATPGTAPATCNASVTPKTGAAQSLVLSVVDENTVKGPDGTIVTREK